MMRLNIALMGLLAVAVSRPDPAFAIIKEYEVLRYLYLHTSCGMAKITSEDVTTARARFVAECQNKTAFPDGAAVVCTDHDDDRSCTLDGKSLDFKHLELLRQKP